MDIENIHSRFSSLPLPLLLLFFFFSVYLSGGVFQYEYYGGKFYFVELIYLYTRVLG